MSSSSLSLAWKRFNDEDSFGPLRISFSLFLSAYLYSLAFRRNAPFHKWMAIHNAHNVGALLLGCASLAFRNDELFSERIPILWSLGYFIVDLWDCAIRMDFQYTLHAAACLGLGIGNYASPILRRLRMNSKATLCELSTPFLHLAKLTRRPLHFAMFAVVFTVCRIVWLPIIMYQLHSLGGLPYTDVRVMGVVAFYGLNLYWYHKIIRIMVTGGKGEGGEKEK
jgi:hypothetical protein